MSVLSLLTVGVWRLTFSDEFNGNELDTTKWHNPGWSVGECRKPDWDHDHSQYYDNRAVQVRNGTLRLGAHRHVGPTLCSNASLPYSFAAGRVDTHGLFSQRFGKVEVNARLPPARNRGVHPAIWMMPMLKSQHALCWPKGGEIDIMESNPGMYQNNINAHYHYGEECRVKQDPENQGRVNENATLSFSESFHTFGVEWSTEYIAFTLDGDEYYRVTNATAVEIASRHEFYLIFNMAVNWRVVEGTDWEEALLEIDWVRVYERVW